MIQAIVVDKCEHCIGDDILLTLDGLLALSPSKKRQMHSSVVLVGLTVVVAGKANGRPRRVAWTFA